MSKVTAETLEQIATAAYKQHLGALDKVHDAIDLKLVESAKEYCGIVSPKFLTLRITEPDWSVLTEQLRQRFPSLEVKLAHNEGNNVSYTWNTISIVCPKYSLFIDDGVSHDRGYD
jgi:hypothetical protein